MRKLGLILLMTVAGCSSDGSQVNITKTVGAGGGTVSQTDGTSVQIPMGALSSSANITIASVTAPAPAGFVLVGPAYDFGPDGTTFATPVTITLPFDTNKIPSGKSASDIRIFTAARGSTNYTMLQTTLGSGSVSTMASHFTVYLPAAPLPTDMGSSVCTPTCMQTSGGCSCTATCGTQMNLVMCSQPSPSLPPSCFCEINGATQSTTPSISSCSVIMTAYNQCFAG
jgi:hypothetical protein